ncbi:MAG: hypothetical protein H7Z21_10520 [Hymenobacter sp.]|nr:hypothetical protein [Hymenobacter sp.]
MKKTLRYLPLVTLLGLLAGTLQAYPTAPTRPIVSHADNATQTKIKLAVRSYSPSATFVMDSSTDFRVYEGATLVAYGYYDEVADYVYIS